MEHDFWLDVWNENSTPFHQGRPNEFLQQYKELTDWLNQVVGVTSKESQTLSEKYLNQVRELHLPSVFLTACN